MENKKFVVTFLPVHVLGGYAYEVISESYDEAREYVVDLFGRKWGFLYEKDTWLDTSETNNCCLEEIIPFNPEFKTLDNIVRHLLDSGKELPISSCTHYYFHDLDISLLTSKEFQEAYEHSELLAFSNNEEVDIESYLYSKFTELEGLAEPGIGSLKLTNSGTVLEVMSYQGIEILKVIQFSTIHYLTKRSDINSIHDALKSIIR